MGRKKRASSKVRKHLLTWNILFSTLPGCSGSLVENKDFNIVLPLLLNMYQMCPSSDEIRMFNFKKEASE